MVDDEIAYNSNQIYLDIKPSIIPIRRCGIEILESLNLRIATSATSHEIITIDDCDAGPSNITAMPSTIGNVKTEFVEPMAPRKRNRMRPKGQPPVRSSLRLQLLDSQKFGIWKDSGKRLEPVGLRNMKNICTPNLNQEDFLQFVGLTSNASGSGSSNATETRSEAAEIPIKIEPSGSAVTLDSKKDLLKMKEYPKVYLKRTKIDQHQNTPETKKKQQSSNVGHGIGMQIKNELIESTPQARVGRKTRVRPMAATPVIKNDPDARSIRSIKREFNDTVAGVQTRSMAVRGERLSSVENSCIDKRLRNVLSLNMAV